MKFPATLRRQHAREREAWPSGPCFETYVRQVAASPRIFGGYARKEAAHLVAEARDWVRVHGDKPNRMDVAK